MGHLLPRLGLNIATHPDFPSNNKKTETPIFALSFPNQKDANNTSKLADYIYYQNQNGRYPQDYPALGGTPEAPSSRGNASRAWPLALTPPPYPRPGGGSNRCSRSTLHVGNQIFYSSTFSPSRPHSLAVSGQHPEL